METDDSDAALVVAAREGDKAAFAALLVRHRPVLVSLCGRMLGNAASAEDVAQEAAIRALLSLDSLRRADRFGSWLCGIGLNVCRMWLRDRSRDDWSWEALQGGRQLVEPADRHPGPAELAEVLDLARRVRRAVDELPAGQRAAVLLFYLAGLTHAEAAEALGIEIGAVKTRLHKARQALRRRLWTTWEEHRMEPRDDRAVGVRVADVRRTAGETDSARACAVLLEETDGARRLTIKIGPFEGEAMAMTLEHVQTSRPITYTFAARLLGATGARLREARISKLEDSTFYAVAVLDGPSGVQELDARPSDAINLALITGSPIRVEPAVFEAAARSSAERAQPVGEGKGSAEIVANLVGRGPGTGGGPKEAE